jgi:hypothetical protein
VRLGGPLALALLVAASPAAADSGSELYDRLWPRVPEGNHLKLSEQITQQLTELGNTLGEHVNVLSYDMLSMTFDGRRRRAHFSVGGGDARYLEFKFASDVHFIEGRARINARVDLSIAGNKFELELPEMEMVPASYRGERGVEVRVPIFKRNF